MKVVKSSEQWYRLGREIKLGEQPLKYVTARPRLKRVSDDEDSEVCNGGQDGAGRQTALYVEFQTTLYEPPPVLYGKVPKNSFGNLDIFVPSMVPKGGVHLPCGAPGVFHMAPKVRVLILQLCRQRYCERGQIARGRLC